MPVTADVHVNGPLTNLAVAYLQNGFFATDLIFPVVPSSKSSNSYFTFSADVFRTTFAQFRAPGAPPAEVDYAPSTATFTCNRKAVAHKIPDPIRADADAPLALDSQGLDLVLRDLRLALEVDWASTFFTTGVWTGSSTATDIVPSTTWDDASATPIEDVQTEARAIEKNTGFRPNVFAMGRQVFDNLLRHPDVIDLIKGAADPRAPAIATAQALASIFSVDRVIPLSVSRNTKQSGVAASYSFVNATDDALLVYAAPSPGIMTPSGGYTFTWNDGSGMPNDMGVTVKRYRNPEREESDQIEVNRWYDHKVVGATLGAFFNGAVA